MEKTPHVLLAGVGANKFAAEQGVPTVPPGSLVSPFAKQALEEYKKRKDTRTEIGTRVKLVLSTWLIIPLKHHFI